MESDSEIVKQNERREQFRKGVLSIIGASLINLIYPSAFAMCTLVVYQTSNIKNAGGNVKINYTMFYYPVLLFFQSIFGLIAGVIYSRIEVHWSNFLGTVLLILAAFIMYISKYFIMDMISMAIYGIAIAIIMFPATTNACKYFMNHIGLVNGIVETAISLGSSFFAFIGEEVINPREVPSRQSDSFYDDKIAKKFKIFLLIQMACYLGSFIICLFLIKRYNENNLTLNDAQPFLSTTQDNKENVITNNEIKTKDYTKRRQKLIKALKSWTFWRYNLISLSQSPISDMVFAMYRGIGESKHRDTGVLQLIGTLTFIIEFILSFVFGVLCDYVNFKILLFSMNIIGTVVGFTYCLTFNSDFFFALATLAISVQSAAYYSLKDYHIMKVFGTDIYTDLSGFVCLLTGIVVIILTFITFLVVDNLTNKDTAYWIMFTIFGAFNGFGVILGFFEEDEPFDFGDEEKEKEIEIENKKDNENEIKEKK